MSDVVVEKVVMAVAPKIGHKLSVKAVINWPVEGENTGITVNTKKKTGELVHSHVDDATGEELTIELPALTAAGAYFVEVIGVSNGRTETFNIVVEGTMPKPGVGFIPVT